MSSTHVVVARARSTALLIVCGVTAAAAHRADAAVEWVDWQAATQNFPSSVSSGQFLGSGTSVTYNGSSLFTQVNGGTDYWAPSAPYLSAGVPNAPHTDIVGVVDFAATHSITFGSAVTNPYMAIVGLGSSSVNTQWVFDSSFTILSQGVGFFGGPGTLTALPGNTLDGAEGSGVIQFIGTFTSISWTVVNGEQPWSDADNIVGITVGLVPAPGGVAAMLLAGSLALRRRRT